MATTTPALTTPVLAEERSLVPGDYANSLFHSQPWQAAVEEAFGLSIETFTPASEPDLVLSYSVIDDIRGRRVVSTPFSDFCEPGLTTAQGWVEFRDHLLSFDAPVTVRPFWTPPDFVDPTGERLGGLLWHGIDLSNGADEMFSRLKSKIRTKIRRVPKAGVTYRVSSAPEDIARMHEMHVGLRKSKYSMLAQPKRFFEALSANFCDDMVVMFAELDGEPIAGMTFFGWNDVWYYKFSASYPNDVRPNVGLMMHSCRVAAERGMQLVDMGRSDDDQPGLLAFKEQFEPIVRSLTTMRWAGTQVPDARAGEVGATLGALTAILTRPDVPDSVAADAGDLLYRFFA